MQKKNAENVQWFEFDLFADFPYLRHGVFLRQGGHSTGEFASLNLKIDSGDSAESVEANINTIKRVLTIPHLFFGRQVHGKAIAEAPFSMADKLPCCDALVTAQINAGLLILHADCQAAIFFDPIHRVVANVHSGWRGSVQNIYKVVVKSLQHKYGSKPQDLLVGISPSLGPQNAEFIHYKKELPASFWRFQQKENHFDFWQISHQQLIDCGLLPHHIEIAKIDTFSHPKHFFSYRRGKDKGRNGTVVALLS